nr:hypothetical protein [Tanacetum cinerariifolium]
MAHPVQNINHSAFRSMFKREKLSENNFNEWFRQLKLVLRVEKKMFVIEQPIPPALVAGSVANVLAEWNALYDTRNEVACLMLGSMTPELHRQFENYSPYEMLQELGSMFEKQAGVERFDLIQTFHARKQEEGKSVAAYVLQMKGYVDQLERLGYVLPQDLTVGLILNGLTKEFAGFVRNYNMHNMGKTIGELHAILIEYEKGLHKKAETPQVMMIKGQKSNKKSLKAKSKGKANGNEKDKQVYIPKPKNPKPAAKEHLAKDDTCHHCKEVGHWKRNCLVNLAELLKKKKQVGIASSSASKNNVFYFNVIPINGIYEIDMHDLVPNVNSMYNVSTERAKHNLDSTYLWHCRLAYITSKNNVFYFNAIPSNGIYEIDMHDLVPNVNSIYNVSPERAKHNLDSTYLWHCRLAHISKKRIEKLQQEWIFKSIDDESFDQCVSCLSGKMTRKSFSHRSERAPDLLGIIHIDVCDPLRHVSSQGASYFITFTDDYSRYGYVYLLKHKHEVFETFKVFKNEVESQLGKTIKALRSDRGCEYINQEFKYYLKACGIVQRLTPPYTPQHNGVGRDIDLKEIQDEDTSPSEITSKIPMEVKGFEPPQEEVISIRRSERTHRAPTCLCLNVEVEEHKIQSVMDKMVWVLVDLAPGCKIVGGKWIFKKNTDMDGIVHTYKARLVAKGYTQLYGVDYEEKFSLVADIRAIRILISITAFYDYEIWQMDVKTAFLNDYLDEDIYMVQPQDFVNPNHPRKVCKLQRSIYGLKNPKAELRVDCYCNVGFDTDVYDMNL